MSSPRQPSPRSVILDPWHTDIRAECECLSARRKVTFTGTQSDTAAYMIWREIHSGHDHLVQNFRTADEGPRSRHACICGSVFSGPALTCGPKLFAWSKIHRRHGKLRGEVS